MEDGFSSIIPGSINFDFPADAQYNEEEDEEAADAIKRDKQIQENLDNISFDKLSEDDDDSQLSDQDSVSNSRQKSSSSYQHHRQSSIRGSYEHSVPPNDLSTSHSNHLPSSHSEDEDAHHSVQNSCDSHEMSHNPSVFTSHNGVTSLQDRVSQFSNQPADVYEEYMKLQILYKTQMGELEQIKREDKQARENASGEIKSLNLRLKLTEGEKDRLSVAVQESQKLISDLKQENNMLKGKLSAVELQLSAETNAKVDAMSKLQSHEITIQSLENQIRSLSQSENFMRLQSQSDSVIKDLQLRHQKESLHLNEEIDKLREKLNNKSIAYENAVSKVSELQKESQEVLDEKIDLTNKLRDCQREYQKLVESGSTSDVSKLRLQLQNVQEERRKLETKNSSLKEEVRYLERELHAYQTLKDINKEDTHKETPKRKSNQQELQNLLRSTQTLRHENRSLKEKLDEIQRQLPLWEERAKLFESKFNDAEKKAKEFEKKLDEVIPGESVLKVVHEKELNVVRSELLDMKKKYQDLAAKFKVTASNEKKLSQDNMNLKNQIADVVQKHAIEKMQAVEECREKCMELHESAIRKLNDELTDKSDKELQTVCRNYEHRVTELQKEIKLLNDEVYETKASYLKLIKENASLQSLLEASSQSKEYKDIEKKIRSEYEKQVNDLKEKIQKHAQDQFDDCVQRELLIAQEDWTKQKMADIKDFVENTKQQLDEEFVKCMEKEQAKFKSELTSEREKITTEYEEKIRNIKEQLESEKESLRESFQIKWKKEIQEFKQSHKFEIESIRQKYEAMIQTLKKDIELLKEGSSRKSQVLVNLDNLHTEFTAEKRAWLEEKEELRSNIAITKDRLTDALREDQSLRRKVKRYEVYTAKYQEKLDKLKDENYQLKTENASKETEILNLNEQHQLDIKKLQENQRKHTIGFNVEIQTEEPVIPQATYEKAKTLFIKCLQKISDEMTRYLMDARTRTAEQLKRALYYYHDQLSSKIFQDMCKDSIPSMCIPRLNYNARTSNSTSNHISPNTMQQQFHAKLSEFSQMDGISSGDATKQPHSYKNKEIVKNTHNTKAASDSDVRFEDISFDFIQVPDSAFMSTKTPDYAKFTGLFNNAIGKNYYPEKLSPITRVK